MDHHSYYFTGTGNFLAVARMLAEGWGGSNQVTV